MCFQKRLSQNPSQHECDLGYRQKQVQAGAVVARVLRSRLGREIWKGLPCTTVAAVFGCTTAWPAVCNPSTEPLPANRTHGSCSFSFLDISGVLDQFTDLRGAVFEGAAKLMPWLMKMLDHHNLGASPGTASVNDFFRKRDRLKRKPSAYFDPIYVVGIAE